MNSLRSVLAIYLIALCCMSLQFFQLYSACAFFADDLSYKIGLASYQYRDFFIDFNSRSVPTYILLLKILYQLCDPFVIKLAILLIVFFGAISLISILRMFYVDWVLCILIVNLAMALRINAEPIYQIPAVNVAASWALCTASLLFFLKSSVSGNRYFALLWFIAAIMVFWLGATTGANAVFLPLLSVPIQIRLGSAILAHVGEGAPDLRIGYREVGPGRMAPLYWSAIAVTSYCILTVGGFLCRKYVLRIEYHYHSLGWVDYSVPHILGQYKAFVLKFLNCFRLDHFLGQMRVSEEFVVALVLSLIIYACVFWYRFKFGRVAREAPLWREFLIAGTFLLGSALTMLPASIVIWKAHRYYFCPSIFAVAGLILLGYSILRVVCNEAAFKGWARITYYLFLLVLISIASYNRYVHIEDRYVHYGKVYHDFAERLELDVKPDKLPPSSQLVILDHPAAELTGSLQQWSTGLLAITTQRPDISGIVGLSQEHSDLFSHELWGKRNGRKIAKTLSGIRKELPLRVYIYRDGKFVYIEYIVVEENAKSNLYRCSRQFPADLVASAKQRETLGLYLLNNHIPKENVWFSTPYPK